MSKTQKLKDRLFSKPKDFTFDEMITLMKSLGFRLDNKGGTSGSAVMFINDDGLSFMLHRPHPGKIIKSYIIRELIKFIEENNLNEKEGD